MSEFMKRRAARLAVERLFQTRLTRFDATKTIQLVYSDRFSEGRCIIGAIIPLRPELTPLYVGTAMANADSHHAPAFISNGRGVCLRLVWRFNGIKPCEHERVLEYTHTLSKWAERLFGMTSVVTSAPYRRARAILEA